MQKSTTAAYRDRSTGSIPSASTATNSIPNPTYSTLASLRDKIRSSKVIERRLAAKELVEKLNDSSTPRNLEREAQHVFARAVERLASTSTSTNNENGGGGESPTYPWDRVCILYRNLMDASLLSSQMIIDPGGGGGDDDGGGSGGRKKRNHANQTGFTKKINKFTVDDILFPYKVFLRMDADQCLESNDGGYGGGGGGTWEDDWKTRPRYGHHVDFKSVTLGQRGGHRQQQQQKHQNTTTTTPTTGRYHARHYKPYTYTNRDRGTRLSSKEIISCVDYCLFCLNDADCCDLAESTLLQWLLHICSRPDYIAELPFEYQLADVLHVISIRINRTLLDDEQEDEERGILPSIPSSGNSKRGRRKRGPLPRECLLTVCKCLSAIIYNTTTRLGIGMQLFLRPVVALATNWVEAAWEIQSEGQFASSSSSSKTLQLQNSSQSGAPSYRSRRRLFTESDIMAVMPYLYSSVTHLLAAHPEQSIAVLSDHGHALLRFVRRNFIRPTTTLQVREALTEYVCAHLLVAETSGKVCGLPEGDLGPLKPRKKLMTDKYNINNGEEHELITGATLDAKSVSSLLEMLRNEKVWESLFGSLSSGGHDGKNKRLRLSLVSGKGQGSPNGSGISSSDGGAIWTPLTRRQRRHLELMARLIRIEHRLYLADVEDRGNGTIGSVECLVEHAVQRMQSMGIEEGVVDIDELMVLPNEINDERHMATPYALASSPWIRMVARHLYKLNPRLGLLDFSLRSSKNAQSSGKSQSFEIMQNDCSDESMLDKEDDEVSIEHNIVELCPMLRSLLVTASTPSPESKFIQALNPTNTATNNVMLDSVSPTTVATLQLLCACAESFPRGECWTSSARRNWSTVLDQGPYPAETLASVVERHGSFPFDAAAVVYLLGTTLESHGGSGGDEDVRLWTLVALLKMTESSAIICSREGLSDGNAFGSPSSLRALRIAWQFVWKTIFRVDLRYSSYTSGAFGNNVGEIVVQLLTQIIRYHCVDRQCMFVCQPPSADPANTAIFEKMSSIQTPSTSCPFVLGEQQRLWTLAVYDDASSLFSYAPFELISNVILCTGFSDTSDATSKVSTKGRNWFVSFCLQFIELAMQDTMESRIRRTYLRFAATCLASLIGDEGVRSASTYEFDGLQLFSVTEDIEPLQYTYDPDYVHFDSKKLVDILCAALWSESVTPNAYEKDTTHGLVCHIVQGRGAFLNKFLNSHLERDNLRCFMDQCIKPGKNSLIMPQRGLGGVFFDTVKAYFDELLLHLRYDNGNVSDDDEIDPSAVVKDQSLFLPKLTGCLSLLLTAIIAKQSTANGLLQDLSVIFDDTISATFDLLAGNLPSLNIHPSDLHVIFDHLHGIVRVLTLIAGSGECEATIHHLLFHKAKPLFDYCKSLLKNYRNQSCTTCGGTKQEIVSAPHFNSDSDDDHIISSRAINRSSKIMHIGTSHSDDYEGSVSANRKQIVPPHKRQRLGKSPKQNFGSCEDVPLINVIDTRCAWACSSLLLELQPSFQSVEFIANHLVWPSDNDNKSGYGFVSMSPDPYGAIVCSSLFCRKSVILRSDRLNWQSRLGRKENDDQESTLIICIESILHARHLLSPSSKYFMCGLGLVTRLVKIFRDSCGAMGIDECKMVLDAVFPEGVGKDSGDYYLLRRWTKRVLKYRSSYRAQQVYLTTLIYLYAQRNLRMEFEGSYWDYFICSSFCHLDEKVRAQACDILDSALITTACHHHIVSDVFNCALPRLDDREKFLEWMDSSLIDQKLRDELVNLEEKACSDAQFSIEFHSAICIGLMAGRVSELSVASDMIWRLIDLAATKPVLLLSCYRACRRASFLLKYKSLGDMIDNLMPHLLVKWLESGRALRKIPILFMAPMVVEQTCRYLPNEMLAMILSNDGWSDDFFRLDPIDSEAQTLNDRVLVPFIESTAKFLIPSILLCSTKDTSSRADATKYLTECVVVLTGVDSDENIAKVLREHISDLYGFVAVLAENGDATLQCQNAFNILKRCVSSVHIERIGAECASLVLRHIILLHRKGISVVGLGRLELDTAAFIEGMKYVAKQLKTSYKQRQSTFFQHLGSSMTENIVLVKYWLATSQTVRQREESCATLSLLWDVLVENIEADEIESGELGFCLHSFISVILDPGYKDLCSEVILHSLKKVLVTLFSKHSKETLAADVKTVLIKLCLALLQVHQRSYENLLVACDSTVRRIEYELRASQGLLAGGDTELPRPQSTKKDAVKCLLVSHVDIDDEVSRDTMLGAYECLEIIASSGKIPVDDISGAEDIFTLNENEDVFRDVNEKFSLQSFFRSIQERSVKVKGRNVEIEAANFIRMMNEHPISADEFDSKTVYTNHSALARLIALLRLEKALLDQNRVMDISDEMHGKLRQLLISICCSKEPEQSRIISSRCLGELKVDRPTALEQENFLSYVEPLNDPMLSIKRAILASLSQYILSDIADTSLVATKTAKAILATTAGKECYLSMNEKETGLLRCFYAHDDFKQRGETIRVSDSCIEQLRCNDDSRDSENWCWHDTLWKCADVEDSTCELWMKRIVVSIICCCFVKGSTGKGDQDLFRICQGLCAKAAGFAAIVFPALIFYLLDSVASNESGGKDAGQNKLTSSIAIGTPTSDMNNIISYCFSRMLSPSNLQAEPQAIRVILNTLELLRSITEHRFLTYPNHTKNKLDSSNKQRLSALNKRSRSPSSSVFTAPLESSNTWKGFPYGVVLRVSGLDVADACFRVKRYYSAIYYAEMSMNNTIGIGTFFEYAANDFPIERSEAVNDISGFGVLTTHEQGVMIIDKALVAKHIIERCLVVIDANDELQGIVSQGAALNLKRNITSLVTADDCLLIQKELQANDIMSRNYLREKWFEDSLNSTTSWDDVLLPPSSSKRYDLTHLNNAPPLVTSQPSVSFYESVVGALMCFINDHNKGGSDNILCARKSVLADMKYLAGSEAQSTGMLPNLAKLSALGHLEYLARTLRDTSNVTYLLKCWELLETTGRETIEKILLNDAAIFDVNEHVTSHSICSIRTELSIKEISLKILRRKYCIGKEVVSKALTSHIYKSCSVYRCLMHPDAARVALSSLRSLVQDFQRTGLVDLSSGKLPLILRLEDARIMQSEGNLDGAVMTCKTVANYLTTANIKSTDIEINQIFVDSLLLGGLWMAENNVDSVEVIFSSYFEKAARLANEICKKERSNSNIHRSSMSLFKLGEFAANLYNSVLARSSSEAWRRRRIVAKERKLELQAAAARLSELQKKTRASNDDVTDAKIIHATLSREVNIDDRELQCIDYSIQRYLRLSFESICAALTLAPTTMTDVSKHVFQLISMWFKNCQRKETKNIVNEIMKSNSRQIPSFRLVPLTYQLFSRIDATVEDGDFGFQDILREIVIKICSEHPYHGIVQLLALSNGQRIGGGVNGRHANAYLENVGTTKVDEVNNIIKELRKRAPEYVNALLDSYQVLMLSYINLAEFDTSTIQKRMTKRLSFKHFKLDLDCCLSREHLGKGNSSVTNMPAIITKPPPIRPDREYYNGTDDPIGTERVLRFEPTFDLTPTGIHRPKIVECIGSKGGRYKQLVKGEDDLRQDAIMQQVFGTVNDLMRHESSSIGATRQLRLITYGITPLSPASGVLEWVDNTMCFGDFLMDKGKTVGAHSKYFPGEWGYEDARDVFRSASEAGNATLESKRHAFDMICENFSPAFRFFFLEYFKSSMEAWHTARTLYTRSCAVNSIVGHILGIGDRHTSNILVHTKTGEVVHIDFGIVFEQGKTLTTPELVPFRLTRDVVDGMGPLGTDGVFSKAAEATMGVMRANADTLLTILSAVVSDPLYKWSLTQLPANQQRNDDERAGNDAAERAITKIHEKLEGYEYGTSGVHKTVAGQVKLLINEARDPDNLCAMFVGWAPWM